MHRSGLSLIEVLVVLVLIGVLLGTAFPPFIASRDRAAVRSAVTAAVAAFDAARTLALTRARHAAVRIDTAAGRLVVHAAADTVLRLAMGPAWGVRLSASRDSSGVAPDGLGYGAANLRLVIRRGGAADTLTVSRLGRVTRR
ncbi:MAG TPA: prepilin-type N-terminal cleavage/methylation domain-containing protein [Gemmatimonadaceae bacterium]|nr:prepilin-type N-terminal cleavage/methylation domain-containing protein [Gemmatimonadaceae bacterium]